ncbi:MAG: deoxyribonuclease IV [Armatimonadota bacterium]
MCEAVAVPAGRLLGAHMPTTGGLQNALTSGHEIGCTAVQLFTASPRQWRAAPLKPETVQAFQEAWQQTQMGAVICHDSYLVNLAAPSEEVYAKSLVAFREELDRCEQLGIPWVVTHMGSYLDTSEEEGLEKLVASAKRLLADTAGYKVGIAMETTAGQGTNLGYKFEHLSRVLDGNQGDARLSVCLDTCHIFVAGYDISTNLLSGVLDEFDQVIGLDRLVAVHANDALKGLGSKKDRHAHIGQGELGEEPFRQLVNEPRLMRIPIILETPESETMHRENLAHLVRLIET